ncbi:hypothetical protein GQ44DRAFT_67341 [Phaeosphaeriaceae sp. PMI808]|nr:hypothetical protein GQ44DRAFT_67341 [Phaeosphaeriaceae sp. PMI808]
MVCSKELLFDGGISDLDVDIVFAFPDQCQMLMNQADAYYFSQEIKKASVVYSRLIRRLAFAPTLNNLTAAKPVPDKPSPSKLALAEAYKRACDDWKLVISSEKQPVLQLESILNQARSKLNRIALGQDIFAHPANWVPRDAFQVYFNDAAQAMKNFDQLSNRLSQYKKAIGVEVKALIEQITTNAENVDGIEAAQIRINELTGTSGILLTNVNKINILHRAVQGQRGTIQKVFENVEQDLRDKFSFDPQSILDGMASFCMMPSKLFAGAEALTLAYKAMTTVESIGGVPVPKNYAIKQLVQLRKEMGSQIARISDLTKCISETKDGTIDVEDPGALKILATSDDIEHILSEYGSAIRGDNAEALKAALKGYIDAVIARNNVILEYNAGLQLLEEAKANKAYHQTQIDEEGKRIINSELSQRLPLIYSWLKKIVDDNWFTAVQCLDNAARATRFWGLVDVDCYKLLDNRYESRSEALKSVFNAIWDACRSRMTSFGNVLPANWPSAGKGQGKFLALTDMELQSLKTPRNIGGKTRYSVSVNFQPRDFLTGQSCVRLYLVRFWIIGATVKPDIPNRNLLSVNIKHMGAESFWNEWGRRFDFVHDCVDMSFKYNARMVQILDDCKYSDDVVLMQTELTKEYAGDKLDLTKEGWKSTDATTHALIGPFSTWYIELLCENDCNPGLDLSKVSEAYLEICTTILI